MNIFEQYGIKEVADVCLYAIELDENDEEIYVPVLYLDTLKVSTVEQTAEQASARGGLGNPELIIWDYGKEITVTLEDALYTPSSMGMLWSGKHGLKKTKLYGDLIISETPLKNGEYNDEEEVDVIKTTAKITLNNYNNYLNSKIEFWNTDETAPIYPDNYGKNSVSSAISWVSNVSISSINNLYQDYRENLHFIYAVDKNANGQFFIAGVDTDFGGGGTGATIVYRIHWEDKDTLSPEIIKTVILDNGARRRIKIQVNPKYNTDTPLPQEMIYQIEHGLNNVKYLERIEKCKATQTFAIDTSANLKHSNYRYLSRYSEKELTVFIDPKTMLPYEPNTDSFTRKNGSLVKGELRIIKQHEIYYKWTRTKATEYTSLGRQIIVDPIHFPGCYRLVGETYSRNRNTGKDQRFQFEIPLCKIGSENNLTLEAEGDPTTFNMTLKVLRREDGVMMKLTQYDVETAKYDGYLSGSTNIVKTGDIGDPEIDPDKLPTGTITEWRFETYITEDNVLSTLSLDITQNNFTVTNTLSNVDEDVDGFLTAAEEKEYRIYRRERKYINNEPTEDTRDIYVRTAISTTPLDPNEYILNLNSLE